ncbi:hypothetical protein JW979_03620 [bacterium]|nr:hypothetical protein [candidate division CSSED10-310 bacterium]
MMKQREESAWSEIDESGELRRKKMQISLRKSKSRQRIVGNDEEDKLIPKKKSLKTKGYFSDTDEWDDDDDIIFLYRRQGKVDSDKTPLKDDDEFDTDTSEENASAQKETPQN